MRKKSRNVPAHHIPDSIPVSVIIPAGNEEKTIRQVIMQAKRINAATEVIVVCNGVSDRTTALAKRAGAKVLEYRFLLGHDVGRAVGAQIASGQILLFIDADFVIPTPILRAYCQEVLNGWDVVLNPFSGVIWKKEFLPSFEAKRSLNHFLGRSDLQGSSFTTVPHACSRRAIEIIGYENLAVPPLAQVKAILGGLSIQRGHSINTYRANRKRVGRKQKIIHLVIGDHVEAMHMLIQAKGPRGGYPDSS